MATIDDLPAAAPDPVTDYVAERVAQDSWGALDALRWAKQRDKVNVLRAAIMMSRLCGDVVARQDRMHPALHAAWGLAPGTHATETLVTVTQRALGLSDAQVARIVKDLDAEDRIRAGLQAGSSTELIRGVA